MRRSFAAAAAALLAVSLAGCQSALFADGRGDADRTASRAGFERQSIRAGQFDLLSYARLRAGSEQLVVYIESDGRAWIDRTTRSRDPTPVDAMVLRLAAADPAPSVAYLGRPCQFLDEARLARCSDRYWTSARFAEEVVASADAAVTRLKTQAGATRVRLVGYSGGGTLAMLLAARRDDISDVVTVVAPLDHAAWTRALSVSPLAGSLNPASFLPRLAAVRQTHFVGGDDKVVPRNLADAFVRRLPAGSPARVIAVNEFSHTCCWDERWPRLLEQARQPAR
jgi:dienelactone hydrolase